MMVKINTQYNKAVVAILSGVVTILAAFGIEFENSEYLISSIGSIITAVLVYLVPNKKKDD